MDKRRPVLLAAVLTACLLGAIAAWALAAGPVSGDAPSEGATEPARSTTPSSAAPAHPTEPRPPAYPSRAEISAAVGYLGARAGRTALAVIDSRGRLSGVRLREHFLSASVVKVMFLTAFLQRLHADHRGVSALDRSLLYPMIHESNNAAASAVLDRVGATAVARLAREAGMRDYAPGVGWWAYTQTSVADQARFFVAIERLIPREFWPYARGLLAGIEPEQSWGIPQVARPRWHVFFKTGALPSQGLFHEAARLERRGVTFAVAVFTTGDPSMAYGEETIRGVGARLLAGPPPG
ncbi:MAG TPA: serine hydrolase [Solirubrobacteraceae bacterium]|nr:serine hydrolase [Solirubrobacteraceae bacterium]